MSKLQEEDKWKTKVTGCKRGRKETKWCINKSDGRNRRREGMEEGLRRDQRSVRLAAAVERASESEE